MADSLASVGEWFFDKPNPEDEIPVGHCIARARPSETPGGSECTDYTAYCGEIAFEYIIGPGFLTVFCKNIEELLKKGAVPCDKCLAELKKLQ